MAASKAKPYEKPVGGILNLQSKLVDELKSLKVGAVVPYVQSLYQPTDECKKIRAMILDHFRVGDVIMQEPRVEFNDLSVIQRMQVDQMAFNTYQSNNGDPIGDVTTAWRSRAMRPIVRNKVISIAAHATARLIFPKVFAYNQQSEEQDAAASVMEDLMEWTGEQSNYVMTNLYSTISALTDPASIVYTEYAKAYRTVKRPKEGGGYTEVVEEDPIFSGFQDVQVPCDQLYIENFFEPDIQKQGRLLWRRVVSYDIAATKYAHEYDNFKYVKPGVQLLYNDANQSFYEVYDPIMRPYEVEEIIYFNRALDLKIVLVNGVMLTPHDNPNPRDDKMYPFAKTGYEPINNRCFYYKSLAFKMQQDANIINTLYPMVIDGTYLNLMPPMVNQGGEIIASDVIVPGAVTTLSDPAAKLTAIQTSQDLRAGMDTLFKVEESINESSQDPIDSGTAPGGDTTAYEISRIEQNAATVLGLFIKQRSDFVRQFGNLRMGDVLQYLTIADASKITDNSKLVYQTFFLHDKASEGGNKTRKIQFDPTLPDEEMSEADILGQSYDTLEAQGGMDSKTSLARVNPTLFRNLKYMCGVNPDVKNPRSEDLERAFNLETYDRAINNPLLDQEQVTRDFLLSTNPKSRRNPDKYIVEQQPMAAPGQIPGQAGPSPLAAVGGQGGPSTPPVA